MTDPKKDNSTFDRKAALRARTLMLVEKPIILETHGGYGKLFQRCYRHVVEGVVFEHDPVKAAALAIQRPSWAVYESVCETAIAAGAGAHLEVNFLDCDPWGEPWPAIEAFFGSDRPFAPKLAVVVNDGLRQKLRMNGGWSVASLHAVVERLGNSGLYQKYLEVCRNLLVEKSARAGYSLKKWTGYYCGHAGQMTHYAALLEKTHG